jgi:5-methylcytosine-specific restriction endonuclease McrA
MPKRRRPPREVWRELWRLPVWQRDGGRCQGPYCTRAPPLLLEECHVDHVIPLSKGGRTFLGNLRILCRRCHVLRADNSHRGMIAKALADGIIPHDWRRLVWE